MPVDPDRVQSLFPQIVELPSEEREESLTRECGSDAELRRRIEVLLVAHDEPASLLKEPAPAIQATVLTGSDQAEAEAQAPSSFQDNGISADKPAATATLLHPRIGHGQVIADRYTLEDQIGEGGMGEVWVAKQSVPVKRRVALKLIKTGMDSQAVLKRFEQERQALAMMDHPNIARVLDGGLTPAGQPFFVMELVNGLSLTKFCDEMKLNPRERLELFLPICHAVQHAHQKGIVHRDLKPANILVTIVDGRPLPKVIDFGVAKATSGKLTEETMATQFGAVVGTLEYMSPEQAGFSGTDIDTRSDIFSLGVILYELLTGLRPIGSDRLKKAALTEMIRIIREEEPSKPSTRLSTDASLPSLAAIRQTDPKKLTALLKGELDWVVMKCLEKQRDRRYETANGLARDIERHLNDEPVEARPPSAGYRLSKFARKHRAGIVTISLVAVSLVLGLGASLWQAVRATRAEALATKRFQSEQTAREAAQTAQEGERKHRLIATSAQQLAQRREYDANMLLVQNDWERNNLEGFHSLLESLRPAEGDDLRGFEWYYWWNRTHRGFVDLAKHTGQVASIAYSPDGQLFASGAGSPRGKGQVRIWDTATRRIVRELPAHEYRVHKVAFSPDGKYLATACGEHNQGGMAKVWDLATGEEVFHRDFKNSVNSVAFSPDPEGAKLVAGSTALIGKWGALKVWKWRTGDELFSQEHEDKGYRGAVFLPDGKRIAAGSKQNADPSSQIEIWDLATQEVQILPANSERVFSIAFRPKDEGNNVEFRLAAAVGAWSGHPGVVKQWDETGRELPVQLVGHTGRVVSVCFSHDGKRIASGCFDDSIKTWDAESGRELATFRGHTSHVLSVAFSPDDRQLASGSGDRLVKLWGSAGQQSLTTERQTDSLQSVTYSRDGTLLASAGEDGSAKIWDATSGLEVMALKPPDEEVKPVYGVAFSPDGKMLATASGKATSFGFGLPPIPGDIRVWELSTQRVIHHFTGHTAKGFRVSFSPDGKRLASVAGGWWETGEVKVWDLETGTEADLGLEGTSGVTWAVEFSPDGRYLAWSRFDYPPDAVDRTSGNKAIEEGRTKSVVVIWDLEKGQAAYELAEHEGLVIDLAFHFREHQLATAGEDETIKIWDLETGNLIQTLRGHSRRVHGVDYSPDGRQLVSCGADGTGKLWDLKTGREVLTFKEHTTFVWSVDFSPDGEHIATTGGDKTIRIWDGTRNKKPQAAYSEGVSK